MDQTMEKEEKAVTFMQHPLPNQRVEGSYNPDENITQVGLGMNPNTSFHEVNLHIDGWGN